MIERADCFLHGPYDPALFDCPHPDHKRFVLQAMVASKKLRKPIWFAKMTGIGPMTTPNLSEAARFASVEDACKSPAFSFLLEIFEPKEEIR